MVAVLEILTRKQPSLNLQKKIRITATQLGSTISWSTTTGFETERISGKAAFNSSDNPQLIDALIATLCFNPSGLRCYLRLIFSITCLNNKKKIVAPNYSRIFPEITQISDLRFIFSEYEHHYHMMWDPVYPRNYSDLWDSYSLNMNIIIIWCGASSRRGGGGGRKFAYTIPTPSEASDAVWCFGSGLGIGVLKNIIYITYIYIYIFFVFVGISFASPALVGRWSLVRRFAFFFVYPNLFLVYNLLN